jgi:peptidoglycan/LPS O-acetylase OafA/YrhL
MRAFAVVVVVLYHANIPGIHGGFLGVDVFFVISGFVITNLLVKERTTTGRNSLLAFYGRRIRRILPTGTIVLMVTIFATYHWLSYITGASAATDAKYVAAFIGNWHFASVGTQYLTASQPPSVFQQYWSLGVEEQFYLVWPVLFILLTKSWGKSSTNSRLIAALTLLLGSSLFWCVIETNHNEVWAFFSPLTHAWELALGALIAVVGPNIRGRSPRTGLAVTAVGSLAILLCVWLDSSSTVWPGTAVIYPVVATGAIIVGGSMREPEGFGRIAAFPPLQWLGNISYSLYLVHWPIIAIATQYSISPLPLWSRLELVVLSLVLSAILYYTFENPIRRSRWLASHRIATFTFGAVLIGMSYATIYWHLSHF